MHVVHRSPATAPGLILLTPRKVGPSTQGPYLIDDLGRARLLYPADQGQASSTSSGRATAARPC